MASWDQASDYDRFDGMAAFLGTTGGACLSCSAWAFASSFSWKRILREAPLAASMKFTLPVSLPVWTSDVYGVC